MNAVRLLVSALCATLLVVTMVLLGVAISLSVTVLNSDFVIAELEAVPVQDFFVEEAKKQIPPEADFLLPLVDQVAEDLEPWAREQAAVVIRAFETYVKGRQAFSATISLVEPKQYLAQNLEEALLGSGMPGLELLNEKQLQLLLQQILQEMDNRVPDTFEITETFLDAETLAGMRMARQYTGYVTWGLPLLSLAALLLVFLTAAVQRFRGRPVTRFVGVALLVAGISSVVLWQVARSMLPGMLPPDIPAEVGVALPGAIARACEPLLVYGVVVLLVGAGLLVLSFKLRTEE